MQFIDHTGHLFSMPSYSSKPIGYEFDETDYVFWMNTEYSWKLSVGTYYMKPIRVLFKPTDGVQQIFVSVSSDKFWLIGSNDIDLALKNSSEKNHATIDETLLSKSLSRSNICIVDGIEVDTDDTDEHDAVETFSLATFYAVCNSDEAGTWETNILINVNNKDWCPITIGAEFVDECEELVVNGMNVGIDLPKDILKAIYQTNVLAYTPDESMFAQKMKELLMNYMLIKGEEGNYKSALAALGWFGWGDKIKLYRLLHTDNEVIDQYIRDRFDLSNDIIYAYKNFRNDALVSISVPLTYEGDEEPFDFNANEPHHNGMFWGENKPETISVFDDRNRIESRYDEASYKDDNGEYVISNANADDMVFYRDYFEFTAKELCMKLMFLKYYYEKYFLPVHMHVNSATAELRVFQNDIKRIDYGFPKITAPYVFIHDSSISVKFPPYNILYFGAYKETMDENFNVFSDTETKAQELKNNNNVKFYYAYDTLVELPIQFISKNDFQLYNVILTLYKDNKQVYTSNFIFTQAYVEDEDGNKTSDSIYEKFIIHPKTLNTFINKQQHDSQFDINYWLSSHYKLTLYVNGNNYEYDFELRLPEMNLCMGTLEYKYDDRFKQIGSKTLSDFTISQEPGDTKCIVDGFLVTNEMNGLIIEYNGTRAKITSIDASENTIIIDQPLSELEYIRKKKVYIIDDPISSIIKMQAFMHMPGLVTIENIDIIEDLYFFQDSLEDYVKEYYESYVNIMNRKHMNRRHMYKITKNKFEVQATINGATSIQMFAGEQTYVSINRNTDIYNAFFDKDQYNSIKEVQSLYEAMNSKKMHYDAFLMIAGENNVNDLKNINLGKYYLMIMSKDTANGFLDEDMEPPFQTLEFGEYTLEYERSDFKFLVNRFVLKSRDDKYLTYENGDIAIGTDGNQMPNEDYGKYQFTNDDIVAFYLRSNEKLPYKVGLSTKWEIKPMSIGMTAESTVESPNEIAIVGVGWPNFRYERGYYNVSCRYSLDDYIQHSMTKVAKFRID